MKAYPYNPQFNQEHNGMDLRDYVAARSMPVIMESMLNTQPDTSVDDFQFVSIDAYLIADEMMKVRGQ